MASLVAVTSGRYLNRFGQRAFAALGIALFALGCLWWRLRVGEAPAYASEMLPGPAARRHRRRLRAAEPRQRATASLPRERFATGSAVFTMTRQVGFVLGVSIFVAVLGTPSRRRPGRGVRPRLDLHDHRRRPRHRDRAVHREGAAAAAPLRAQPESGQPSHSRIVGPIASSS